MATLIVVEDLAHPAVAGRGGHAMYLLQLLHGLRRLGHEVLFVEFLDEEPGSDAVRHFESVIGRWWSADSAALLVGREPRCLAGADVERIRSAARRAAGVLTVAAHYRSDPWPLVGDVRPRVLFDQDPAYTQLWAAEGDPREIYGEHDLFFTVGVNIGTARCRLPTVGIDWRPLWNPVVLDWWDPARLVLRDRFTTITSWRDYGYLEWDGKVLGPKVEEFHRFIELPSASGEEVELVLEADPHEPDRELLGEHGWLVEDSAAVQTPDAYREYITASAGEFSCVKGGYAGTRCGWFSDRSACYLAAGRPVVLQATGFEDVLPTGEGLFAVRDVDEAAEAIAAVGADFTRHSSAARSVAREYFDSDRILGALLAEIVGN